MAEKSYFILSIKHSPNSDGLAVWWRPNDAGYCTDLDQAGQYLESEVDAHRRDYDNGISTRAVPVEDALKQIRRVMDYDRAKAAWPPNPPAQRTFNYGKHTIDSAAQEAAS